MYSIKLKSKHAVALIAMTALPVIFLVGFTLGPSPATAAQTFASNASSVSAFTGMSRAQLIHARLWRLKMDHALAPIHSRRDLAAYLRITASTGSPLDALSPAEKKHFLSNLQFSSGRLAGYSYLDLQKLTPIQVYRILSLFGAQSDTRMIVGARGLNAKPSSNNATTPLADWTPLGVRPNSDHRNFKCIAGNCEADDRYICNPEYCHNTHPFISHKGTGHDQ